MRGHRGSFAHHDGITEQGMNLKRNSYITNFMPPSLHHEVARVRLPRLCQAEGGVAPCTRHQWASNCRQTNNRSVAPNVPLD